jgi:hypothetical protein
MPDDFSDTKTTFNFDVLDILWVEVFSENHDDYKIYAIEIKTSTPTVLDVTLGGRSASGGILPNGQPVQRYGDGLGTPAASIADAVEGQIWFGEGETGLDVVVTPEDSNTAVLVATGAANGDAATLFPAGYISPAEISPVNNNYLYLKAVSADAQGETIYYKLKLIQKTVSLAIGDVTIQGVNGTPISFDVGAMGTNGFGGGENHGNGAQLAPTESFKNILNDNVPNASVTVNIATKPAGAPIRYGHTDFFNAQEGVPSTGHITLTYQDSNVLTGVTAGEYIAVEVANGLGDKGWYAFRVAIGQNSDITSLTVGGDTITLADAKNTAANGTMYATYRLGSAPTDTNSDGLWDSLAIAATGSSSPVRVAVADTVGAAIAENAWQTAANGSYTFTDLVSTGKFLIVHIQNQDTLDYYYKVRVLYGSSDAVITGATVGGVTATIGTPGSEVPGGFGTNIVGYTAGAVTLSSTQATPPEDVAVVISGLPEGAMAEYGLGMNFGGLMPPWGPPYGAGWLSSGTGLFGPMAPVNAAIILIRVTSQDKGAQSIYVINSSVSD